MSNTKITTLFRPVGLVEMGLLFDSNMKEFPPRLPEQPIFYPVLNREYARQIARDWNAPAMESGYAGFVTKFDVPTEFVGRFPVKTVGNSVHQELWVPSGELRDFNAHIVGHIQAIEAFCGKNFVGFIPEKFGLAGKNSTEQLLSLAATMDYSGMDFICETAVNAKAVYLNYPFWTVNDFTHLGISAPKKEKVVNGIATLWPERFPSINLCKGTA